jgi:hypothetical protein
VRADPQRDDNPARAATDQRHLDALASGYGCLNQKKIPLDGVSDLALLWQNLAIDWRNWIPESDFQ